MKNIKKLIVLSLVAVFFSWGLMAEAVSSDNAGVSSDNGGIDLSPVYGGGLQTKDEILDLIKEKKQIIEKKINNSELIILKRIPTALRNSVLSLNVIAKNALVNMETKVAKETDIAKIKSIVQKEEASSNANKMLILYNQSALLLKNYNRVYETLQNSYKAVNDAINYIDIHNPNSSKYLGKDPFNTNLYNTEIAPLRDKLEKIKIEKLDVLKASLDAKMNDLSKHNFASLSDSQADEARRDVLDVLVLDLPVYRTDYNTNIKNDIVSNVNDLLVVTGAKTGDLAEVSCPEMIDADGNVYQTVLIGDQCWTKENIRMGEMITVTSQPNPSNGIIEKWCYNDDPAQCDANGGLYNWNEAMQVSSVEGARGICAPGWHIPTDAEFNILEKYVLGVIASPNAQYVCDLSYSGWQRCADNTGANGVGRALKQVGTDLVGFAVNLSGYSTPYGDFYSLGEYSTFWSSTPGSATSAWRRLLGSGSTVYRGTANVAFGYSVRCLKD
jgi:uncharacterized protein (TIGR02145 family)